MIAHQLVFLCAGHLCPGHASCNCIRVLQLFFTAKFLTSIPPVSPTSLIMLQLANTATYATADGCVGYTTDCFDPSDSGYPCAFANVDLTGTPFSMHNDFTLSNTLYSSGAVIFDTVANKTVSLYAGGACAR